jgi:glycosyltransferase involved in cell wall biosynthesis
MNVAISVFGRFHAFYLADQLNRRGHLQRLITTYPKFEVRKYGIPSSKTTSLLAHGLVGRATTRFPPSIAQSIDARVVHESYDIVASQRIPSRSDIFVGWSGFSERGLRRARAAGAITILERNSTHIVHQRDILREEYERFGVKAQLPHEAIVEKELREYEMADYICVPSEYVRRTFLDKGFSLQKVIKVPFGVDVREFQPSSKSDDTFRVVYAGSMSVRKGVPYLLQAFSELSLPNAELWLIGTKLPEIEPFFQKFKGSFRHVPPVPQSGLSRFYAQSSVFALCSVEEGFGLVLAQAMACGLPVIATTHTGASDLIDHGKEGFVLPIRDVDALKRTLLHLHGHPAESIEMGRAAHERVQRFTWDDYGRRIVECYSEILGTTGDTRRNVS